MTLIDSAHSIFRSSFFSAIIFVSCTALAQKKDRAFLIEPIFTVESGSWKTKTATADPEATGALVGIGVGAKLGYRFWKSVYLAADVRYSVPTKDAPLIPDSNATVINYAPTVGFEILSWRLRLWAGAIIGGEINPSESNGTDLNFTEGKGYRVGLGKRLFKSGRLSLNLEYQDTTYGKAKIEKQGPLVGNGEDIIFTNKSIILGISVPFAF